MLPSHPRGPNDRTQSSCEHSPPSAGCVFGSSALTRRHRRRSAQGASTVTARRSSGSLQSRAPTKVRRTRPLVSMTMVVGSERTPIAGSTTIFASHATSGGIESPKYAWTADHSSSTLRAMTSTSPVRPKAKIAGSSSRQGPHHVAHRCNKVGLGRGPAKGSGRPFRSTVRFGSIGEASPAAADADDADADADDGRVADGRADDDADDADDADDVDGPSAIRVAIAAPPINNSTEAPKMSMVDMVDIDVDVGGVDGESEVGETSGSDTRRGCHAPPSTPAGSSEADVPTQRHVRLVTAPMRQHLCDSAFAPAPLCQRLCDRAL